MPAQRTLIVIAALLTLSGAGRAVADPLGGSDTMAPAGTQFSPQVPVSAFARPARWFDPSRLQVSTSVSVGSYNGKTDGLQVTSLAYQLGAPLAVRLSVGNAFGASGAARGNGMFLEGFAVAYKPHPSFQINVDYRDLRSPLQYSRYSDYTGFGSYGR
ncbi:MAG TPA: hypothetical protein VJY35_00345 [Candidatus Eisenbacteria bacterium]|nr:hypothetical protein [Candidatus Eisenbacteria bacterium]